MFTARDSRMSNAECQDSESVLLVVIQISDCFLLSATVQSLLLSATVQIVYWLSESIMSTAECQSPECLLLSFGQSRNI
jgi:poly-beta-hydroxyalkanoate depolymerase